MLTAKVIGEPDINPLNFKKAIIDPEKVIAPTAAPIDISTKLASLILPTTPKLKASGLRNAAIATKTAAKPTKLKTSYQFWHCCHWYSKGYKSSNSPTN